MPIKRTIDELKDSRGRLAKLRDICLINHPEMDEHGRAVVRVIEDRMAMLDMEMMEAERAA